MNGNRSASTGRTTQVILVGLVAAAAIGYFVGIRDGVPMGDREKEAPSDMSVAMDTAESKVADAVSYDELGRMGPAAYRGNRYIVADLGVPSVDLSKEVEIDPEAKPVSLAERAERRAYNGAPPTIPHDVEQIGDGDCVACHATAIRVGELGAPVIPHAYYVNCQQCHVADSPLAGERILSANSFVGLPAPESGSRAWTGAPPTVPHSTWMRENCRACHGPQGLPGLRTSHPGRTNCLQCHGRSAALDPLEPTVAALLYDPPAALLKGVGVPPPAEGAGSEQPADGSGPGEISR